MLPSHSVFKNTILYTKLAINYSKFNLQKPALKFLKNQEIRQGRCASNSVIAFIRVLIFLACATELEETLLWLSLSVKQHRKPCSGLPPGYQDQDLSMFHDWPVKNAIVHLPMKMKGNLKCFSGNSLSKFSLNKAIGAAS